METVIYLNEARYFDDDVDRGNLKSKARGIGYEVRTAVSGNVETPKNVDEFRALLRANATFALSQLSNTFRTMEDAHFGGDAFVRSLAGGAPESITWALYNSVGDVFPSLSRSEKDLAVGHTLAIMDQQNYVIVNGGDGVGHTTGIREPLYLGEICTVRGLYWPGLDEGKLRIVQQDGDFDKVRTNLMTEGGMFRKDKVHSDFLVAYAFLRSDFSSFGERFVEVCDKGFMDRTVTAIAKIRVAHARTGGDVQKGFARLRELLPRSLHERIEPASKIEDWVDPKQFP